MGEKLGDQRAAGSIVGFVIHWIVEEEFDIQSKGLRDRNLPLYCWASSSTSQDEGLQKGAEKVQAEAPRHWREGSAVALCLEKKTWRGSEVTPLQAKTRREKTGGDPPSCFS